jgi:hypothetical protein
LRSDRTQLRKDEETGSLAKLGGHEIEVATTLREARLSRASLLWNERDTNQYYSLTTTIKPCNIDVAVTIDGERMDLKELLRQIVNGTKKADQQISKQQFANLLAARSYLQSSMVMVTQHNGLSESRAEELFDLMRDQGATDVLETIPVDRRNNIQQVVDFGSEPGLEIQSMVLGSVDRSRPEGTGRGFENLVSAQVENFTRILAQHAVRYGLEKELKAKRAKLSVEEIEELQEKIAFYRRAGSTWANNWGGVQEIMRRSDPGDPAAERVATGEFTAVNVPCGDFVVTLNDGSTKTINLWVSRKEAQAELMSKQPTEAELDDMEEVF